MWLLRKPRKARILLSPLISGEGKPRHLYSNSESWMGSFNTAIYCMRAKPFIVLFWICWNIIKHRKSTYWNNKCHLKFLLLGFGSFTLKTYQNYLPEGGGGKMLWSKDDKLVVRKHLENCRVWISSVSLAPSEKRKCVFSALLMWGLRRGTSVTLISESLCRPRCVQAALKVTLVRVPTAWPSKNRIPDTHKK